MLLAGVTTTVKVAHVRLCHSRMFFVRAYPRETQEMVFDAHARAFAFFGRSLHARIYDNMTTAVDAVFVGTRVAALANWPGRIKSGEVKEVMHVVDMFPTLAGLAVPARKRKTT